MSDPTGPLAPIDPAALRALVENLRDPDFRAAFCADPNAALARSNVPELPPELLTHLAELSDEELEFLAREAEFFDRFPIVLTWL